jgi:ribosomal protein S18 acetylase RimI-like enzyme
MKVKTLGIQDYDAVLELWRRSGLPSHPRGRDSREAFARQLETGAQTALGLEEEGQLIGVVIATHDGRKGWINRLAIDPDHQRQGHARRLIAAAEKVLKTQDMHVIGVLVEKNNAASLTLFEQAGYSLADYVYYLSKRDSAEA